MWSTVRTKWKITWRSRFLIHSSFQQLIKFINTKSKFYQATHDRMISWLKYRLVSHIRTGEESCSGASHRDFLSLSYNQMEWKLSLYSSRSVSRLRLEGQPCSAVGTQAPSFCLPISGVSLSALCWSVAAGAHIWFQITREDSGRRRELVPAEFVQKSKLPAFPAAALTRPLLPSTDLGKCEIEKLYFSNYSES